MFLCTDLYGAAADLNRANDAENKDVPPELAKECLSQRKIQVFEFHDFAGGGSITAIYGVLRLRLETTGAAYWEDHLRYQLFLKLFRLSSTLFELSPWTKRT